MSDTVSKLYAEIGFKVNQDGLKQAQRFLTSLHRQMSALNNATKEAAKQYGIFSKNENKQSLADERLATQQEKTEFQRNKRRIENKKFEHKQLMDLAKLEFQVEKYNAAEKNKIEFRQAREAEQRAKERQKRLRNSISDFRAFAVGLRNTFLGLIGVGAVTGVWKSLQESRQRALNIRDFQFETGVGFEDLQKYRRQFNIMGSRLKPEDIMEDLANVQQNLVDISLGKGHLSGFKLAGVRAAAGMGSSVGVIEELRKVAKTQAIDNATLINVMRDIGLKNAGQWLMNFRTVQGDDERTRRSQVNSDQETEILLAELEIQRFRTALSNAKDQITAKFAPVIQEYALKAKQGLEDFAIALSEGTLSFGNIGKVVIGLKDILMDLMPVIVKVTGLLLELADKLVGVIWKLGESVGDKIAHALGWDKDASEHLNENQKYVNNIIKYGKSGKLAQMKEGYDDDIEALALFGRTVSEAKKYYEGYKRINPDVVSKFNNDSRIISRNIVNATDNRVQNVTINGVAQEEIAEKAKEAVEEANKKEETMLQQKLYGAADLWVVAPTIAG